MKAQGPPSFALIAEGPSDHIVLTHLLAAYFQDPDIVANPLQPPSAQIPGGWTEVLRYCSSPRLERAFVDNDFVVIQIDTDVCEEVGFGVPRRGATGDELAPDALADAVTHFLISRLPPTVYERFADRIIFAVCVDSIECWLLPLYYNDGRRSKTAHCLGSLNQQLSIQEKFSIDQANKQTRYYENIMRSKKCGKRKTLEGIAAENPSLTRFIRALDGHFPAARMFQTPPVPPQDP
jgi:hypothetical protein